MTNEERSLEEVSQFLANPPSKYFLYVKKTQIVAHSQEASAITWMGDILGHGTVGSPYRSNFGDTRRAVHIRAINGFCYEGIYFESSGDYARVRLKTRKGEPVTWKKTTQ
jgi:hypothetical protein